MAIGEALLLGKESISTASALARQRQAISEFEGGDKPSFLQNLLPIFGGLLGGKLLAGIQKDKLAGLQNGTQQGSGGLGLPAVGAGLTDALQGEIGAINAATSARLSAALNAANIEASQRGGLRTGTQQTRRDDLRLGFAEAATRQVGAVGLESEALRQSQLNAQRNFDLQVASLEAQKAQGTNQLITAVATLLGQGAFEIFGGQIKSKLFGGGGLDDTGGLDFGGDIFGPEFNDEFIG